MAIRWDKEKVRSQAAAEIARTAPGEQPIVTFHATANREGRMRGPRFLARAWRLVARRFGRNYFVSLTGRRVAVHRLGGAFRTRIVERYRDLPRGEQGGLVRRVREGGLYDRLWLALPGEEATLDCEVVHYWRPELHRFLAELAPAAPLAPR
ncbi:hypothetical protein [Streptomyces hoynatensis]|uniref:Uncharacterized protein n=1 Tax=Streptomyces hoynatensis TaxID=1141874 RepID=A0A3A9YUX9_9ACTN|nr:hypothetical protein [Streptomyces hoynatensis]RKN39036.1 hypothetical protein D7294_22945 [Streptomyces hoynatensis]